MKTASHLLPTPTRLPLEWLLNNVLLTIISLLQLEIKRQNLSTRSSHEDITPKLFQTPNTVIWLHEYQPDQLTTRK